MKNRIIPDATFFSFFLHNTCEPNALKTISEKFYMEVTPKVHNEIKKCKSYCHLNSFTENLHIFDERMVGFSEILKPLFSEMQKDKGEHDLVVVGICYHQMKLDFIMILDDIGARKFTKENFPFLEEHLEWTANFIRDCGVKYKVFNKVEVIDLLNKMKQSSKTKEGFRISGDIIEKLITEVENGGY